MLDRGYRYVDSLSAGSQACVDYSVDIFGCAAFHVKFNSFISRGELNKRESFKSLWIRETVRAK